MLFLLAGCLEDKNDFNYNVTNKMDDFEVRNVVRNYSLFKVDTESGGEDDIEGLR